MAFICGNDRAGILGVLCVSAVKMMGQKNEDDAQRDPSILPGAYRSRVFIGGTYVDTQFSVLNFFGGAVRESGFEPIIADEYRMAEIDLHDITMYLLHSCRLALFEGSAPSGALMELERTADYGTQCMVLYREQEGYWRQSRMLSSFCRQHEKRIKLCSYTRPAAARREIQRWLRAMREAGHGR